MDVGDFHMLVKSLQQILKGDRANLVPRCFLVLRACRVLSIDFKTKFCITFWVFLHFKTKLVLKLIKLVK